MLKWTKRLLLVAIFLAALIIGVVFTIENSDVVAIVFFGFRLPELTIGLWMLLAVLLGAVIGVMVSYLPLLFNRFVSLHKDKKINQLQKELASLRLSDIKRR